MERMKKEAGKGVLLYGGMTTSKTPLVFALGLSLLIVSGWNIGYAGEQYFWATTRFLARTTHCIFM